MPKPKLAIVSIVRNESRDLPRMLASVKTIADLIYIVDTGSTDDTVAIAKRAGAKVKTFTKASEKNEAGEWLLWDFSAARNHVIEWAEKSNATHLMWMDADDVLITPSAIKRAMYWTQFDCMAVWIDGGGTKWIQHRLVKNGKGARFKGRCHEYLNLDGLACYEIRDSLIVHHADPHPGEGSNARNLRMLMREWEEQETPRTAFYIANTHRDAGRHKEGAEWYGKRVDMGEGFRDEYLFAMLYGARCLRSLEDYEGAKTVASAGIAEAPTWAEFRMELAHCYYVQKHYTKAIEAATPCLTMQPESTVLWREQNAYTDQPARLISWCHEHIGNEGQALVWAEEAQRRIGGPDPQWDTRVNALREKGKPKGKARDVICLRRPGAIGDVLMTLNLIPALREANPGMQIHYFTSPQLSAHEALGSIILQAGADQVLDAGMFDAWSKTAAKSVDLVGYPLAEGYPDKPMTTHLLRYFGYELGLDVDSFSLPSLNLSRPPRPEMKWDLPERYCTIQMEAGWSRYKQWMPERWQAVMDACHDIPFRVIEQRAGLTLSQSIALFANATMHVGIDSFCNHLTNYYWEGDGKGQRVPAVILWGSTQASAAGYPHNTNISLGLPCQPCFRENPAISRMPRGPCINPPRPTYEDDTPTACMGGIGVERVIEAVRDMWEQTK